MPKLKKQFCATVAEAVAFIQNNWEEENSYNVSMNPQKETGAPKWFKDWYKEFKAEYDQDMKEIKTDIKVLKEDMVEVKRDIALLKEDMVEVKRDIALMKSTPTMQKELKKLKK